MVLVNFGICCLARLAALADSSTSTSADLEINIATRSLSPLSQRSENLFYACQNSFCPASGPDHLRSNILANMATDVAGKPAIPSQEYLNPANFIYDYPIQIPMADLLNPVTVKVTVWNKTEDPEGTDRGTFEIMRGVICSKSAYFEKIFKGKFKEATEESVTLDDVPPWIFKVFLTWLYTGLVYIDDEQGAQSKPGTKRKCESLGMDGSGPCKTLRTDDRGTTMTQAPSHVSPPEPDVTIDQRERYSFGGEIFTFVEEALIKSSHAYHAETEAPDEKDLSNPITWPWGWLFDMYVFADQYDTQRLRTQVMHLIQIRLDQRRPRMYLYPDHIDTQRCVDRLPSSSPLRRLLVDLWAKNMRMGSHGDPKDVKQVRAMELLPQTFLIECFIALKGEFASMQCEADPCVSLDHHHEGKGHLQAVDRGTYHEHGETDQEKNRYFDLWDILQIEYFVTELEWRGVNGAEDQNEH